MYRRNLNQEWEESLKKNDIHGWFHDYTIEKNKGHYMVFEAKQDIIITGAFLYLGLVEEDVIFTVYGPDTTTVVAEQTLPVLDIDEDDNGKVEFNLDLHIPKGDQYFLTMQNSSNTRVYLDNQQPGSGIKYDYPYVIDNLFEAKYHVAPWGEDNFMYAGLYDIKVESKPSCGRVPVKAIVKSNCVLPDLTINLPTNQQNYDQEIAVIDVDVTDADGTVVKVIASIIDKDNFKTVATIELAGSNGNYTGEWEAEDIGDYIVEVEATDDDGNKTKDQVEVTVSSTVGVEKVGQNSLDFYLNHENTKLLFKQEGDYMIYDMKGSLAAKGVVSNNSVDINSLKPGLYNVKINNQVGSFVKK